MRGVWASLVARLTNRRQITAWVLEIKDVHLDPVMWNGQELPGYKAVTDGKRVFSVRTDNYVPVSHQAVLSRVQEFLPEGKVENVYTTNNYSRALFNIKLPKVSDVGGEEIQTYVNLRNSLDGGWSLGLIVSPTRVSPKQMEGTMEMSGNAGTRRVQANMRRNTEMKDEMANQDKDGMNLPKKNQKPGSNNARPGSNGFSSEVDPSKSSSSSPPFDTRGSERWFWRRVDKAGDCWLWKGWILKQRGGYGGLKLFYNGKYRKVRAHRIAYQLQYGAIPAGLLVCHTCDNPPCVRPEHLFLGTNADNTHDSIRKGRWGARKRSDNANLTWEVVGEIRDRFLAAQGKLSQYKLARTGFINA